MARLHYASELRLPALLLASALVLGCGSSSEDEGRRDPTGERVREFRGALETGDYAAADALMLALDARIERDPDDGTAVLFAALARMWRLGEARRDPSFDLAQQAPIALKSLAQFKRARELNPHDGRIPAWIGFMTTRIGEAIGDRDTIEEGKVELDGSLANFETFTHFVRGITLLGRKHDDPVLDSAAEDMWAVLDACGYDVDRANPDYAYPTGPLAPPAHICRDTPLAKHNWKGYFLHAGDVFSKTGDAVTAVRFWEHAKRSPTFSSWRYADVIEERIATAEERTRLLTDADPGNDPELFAQSAHVCVGCHAD